MTDAQTDPSLEAVPAPIDPVAEAIIGGRLAATVARFGEGWTDEQRSLVRRVIARHVERAADLRRRPLANGDEPEIVFAPFGRLPSDHGRQSR